MRRPTSRNSKPANDASTLRASTSRTLTIAEVQNFVLKNRVTALVVDDAFIGRDYHKRLLTNLGVETREVSNGQDAVALCREGDFFHLILMDMEMPIMNGTQATRLLREMGCESMIVGVTAHSKEWEVRQFMDAGLDDYLEKPLTFENIFSVIRDIDDCLSTINLDDDDQNL
ncbi:two-component response regulator 24-like [Macadamia integrifolia]|uniref:two-component response regulator 24-like n=1 Tax=Macadamia integrifolia TaxID=60698 RepID=UPI001C50251D|nr:two-component response regulator 24-like [Macadamia integrifolia]